MTKKNKAKKQEKDHDRKKSAMLKQQAAIDINKRFRAGTLWEKKK